MEQIKVGKRIGSCDYDYHDCINRWVLKRTARKLFPAETEMRKLKVTYQGRQEFGYAEYNIYKVVSAEGVCKYVGMYYNSYEGGEYYELHLEEEK